MAPPPDLLETLTNLTSSLSATTLALNSSEFPSLQRPENGISLLDVKNELLLSYIHNVVFLVLVRLRSGSLGSGVGSDVVKELVKIRVLLERGVKPLEGRLKYQIDKVIAAAAADEGAKAQAAPTKGTEGDKSDEDEDEDDEMDDDDGNDHERPPAGSMAPVSTLARKELAFRPNPAALSKPTAPALTSAGGVAEDGIYRPPRISATVMPELPKAGGSAAGRALPKKSHMLDEFIANELSAAPLAEPSIGSTITAAGRVVKTTRDRREEAERQEYEESNFVRLPKISKKEAGSQKRRGGREANGLGGEDWTSFAGDVDRLTKGVERTGKSSRLLEKSRKRPAEEDGDGGRSRNIGQDFERTRRRMTKKRKA